MEGFGRAICQLRSSYVASSLEEGSPSRMGVGVSVSQLFSVQICIRNLSQRHSQCSREGNAADLNALAELGQAIAGGRGGGSGEEQHGDDAQEERPPRL
jgi:hypothetical protein